MENAHEYSWAFLICYTGISRNLVWIRVLIESPLFYLYIFKTAGFGLAASKKVKLYEEIFDFIDFSHPFWWQRNGV